MTQKISVFWRDAGVEFLRQVLADDAVEGLGDDLAVEVLDVELDLVGRGEEVDLVAVAR